MQQVCTEVFLLCVTATVLFPIMWIFSLALDPRNIGQPLELRLIPPGASLQAFDKVLLQPFELLCKDPSNLSSCMTFGTLLKNSLIVALGTSLVAVILGSSAAYAFSRFALSGVICMIGVIVLLMLPTTATLPRCVLAESGEIAASRVGLRFIG